MLSELDETFGDLVKVMFDNHVAMTIEERLAVLPLLINVAAGVVLSAVLAGGEKYGIVLDTRA